jgi:hypothetical protein
MKVKLVLASLAVAGLAVSTAVAAPPEGKGKPKTTGEGCKPRISVILKGTLTAVGNPLTVNVTSANHWGKAYVGPNKKIATTTDTKVRGQGMKQLSELKSGFRVLIQARVCKADLANGATPALTAAKVIAHDPTKKDNKDENENKGKDNKDKDDDD